MCYHYFRIDALEIVENTEGQGAVVDVQTDGLSAAQVVIILLIAEIAKFSDEVYLLGSCELHTGTETNAERRTLCIRAVGGIADAAINEERGNAGLGKGVTSVGSDGETADGVL